MAYGYSPRREIPFRVIGDAWRLYKRHWAVWSLAALIAMTGFAIVDGLLISILGGRHRKVDSPGGFAMPFFSGEGMAFLLAIVANGLFTGGMIRMADRQIRGDEPRIEDMFSVTKDWFDVVLVSLLYGVAIMAGTTVFVIPGLILSGILMLALPLVVLGGLPATGAIIQSFDALKGRFLTAPLFHLWLIIVAFSGMLLLGVGILMTGPLYSLAIAGLYHHVFPGSQFTGWDKKAAPMAEV
jgi:hypothetical protein